MKIFFISKPRSHGTDISTFRQEDGVAVIGTAIAISAILAAGAYFVSSRVSQATVFEHDAQLSAKLVDYSLDSLELAAQLIQSGALIVDRSYSAFRNDSPVFGAIGVAGGLGWSFSPTTPTKIQFSFCPSVETNINTAELLSASAIPGAACPEARRIHSVLTLSSLQVVENIMPDGSIDERFFAYLDSDMSANASANTLAKKRRARVRLPSVVTDGTCRFTKPNNSTLLYIAEYRSFPGWTKLGIPYPHDKHDPPSTTANRLAMDGYASVHYHNYLLADPWCQDVACNYWKPSTASEEVHTWLASLGGMYFGVRLHIPTADPGSCYLAFHPNRRPGTAWNNGCFAAGTLIRMADMSLKPVQRIEEGDQVYNPVTRRPATVSRTIAGPELSPMLVITTTDAAVTVSSQHPFQTAQDLKSAKQLRVGDRILSFGGRLTKITGITKQIATTPPTVYNLALVGNGSDAEHMIEADGIVTGDLFLQEKVSGVDPTKRPYTPSIKQHAEVITNLMLKK